jgi:hypothetical protein
VTAGGYVFLLLLLHLVLPIEIALFPIVNAAALQEMARKRMNAARKHIVEIKNQCYGYRLEGELDCIKFLD